MEDYISYIYIYIIYILFRGNKEVQDGGSRKFPGVLKYTKKSNENHVTPETSSQMMQFEESLLIRKRLTVWQVLIFENGGNASVWKTM